MLEKLEQGRKTSQKMEGLETGLREKWRCATYKDPSISFLSFLFVSLTHKHTFASASLSKALHFNIYYV